jgi:RNA polymerase sigma-70 factor (ECF subfamily)
MFEWFGRQWRLCPFGDPTAAKRVHLLDFSEKGIKQQASRTSTSMNVLVRPAPWLKRENEPPAANFVKTRTPPAQKEGTPVPNAMNATEPDLNTLLERIGRGETDLFLHVVRRYELMLRGYLAGQLYDLAVADDLAQEVFIAAWRDLAGFRRGEDFGAWLRGIARNRLLMHFRSHQRRANAVERFQAEVARIAEQELDGASRQDEGGRLDRLLHCISRLPEKLRRVVHAGLHGARPASLAEELGTTVSAIYQLHYRANQLLRECMTGKDTP